MRRINELVDGSNDAPLMFFLHGWPDTPQLWARQVAYFKSSYQCVCLETPNFGDQVEAFYSFEEVTSLIIESIKHHLKRTGQKNIVLVGHDWGAYFAYQVEAKSPDLVSRLITMDVGSILKPEKFLQALGIVSYQWTLVFAFYLGRLTPKLGNLLTRSVANVIGVQHSSRPQWNMNYLYVNFWKSLLTGKVGKSKIYPDVPLLFFYGKRKPFMFHMEFWLRGIKSVGKNKVMAMEESGHWLMLDEPHKVNEIMNNWLHRL